MAVGRGSSPDRADDEPFPVQGTISKMLES